MMKREFDWAEWQEKTITWMWKSIVVLTVLYVSMLVGYCFFKSMWE